MVNFGSGGRDRVRDLCRRLKPILGGRMDGIHSAYAAEDADGRKQIEAYLEALAARHLAGTLNEITVNLVPPSPEALAGPYELGNVIYGKKRIGRFGLRENEWIQHVGVFGRSGAGKTNLGFSIFDQLKKHGKPTLVFDWKRNYRDLLALEEFQDVEVYTLGRNVAPFYFNPLIPPPGTDPKTWLKQLIEVIAHSYALGNGVLFLLQETLDVVYNEAGAYDGAVDQWPTFRHILEKARERNARGRESAWLSSTLRALASLTFGEMDRMLNTPHDQSRAIGELLKKDVILEMDALGQADKVFVISALLLYIHHLRMAEGEREQFKHAVMIEEAHHVLSNERRSFIGGQSVMEITFREIREFGEAIVILDQHPSKIALSALGNTYFTACLNLKHQKDVNAMGQSMLLDGDEKDILGSLEVGQAVVKLQGRTAKPFLMEIPEFPIKKGVITDNAIRLRMEGHYSPVGDAPIEARVHSEPKPSGTTDGRNHRDESFIGFLRDIDDYPESGVAARYKRLEISVRQGQKLKSRITERGFIEEVAERTKYGRTLVIRLTEKGQQFLDRQTDRNETS